MSLVMAALSDRNRGRVQRVPKAAEGRRPHALPGLRTGSCMDGYSAWLAGEPRLVVQAQPKKTVAA
jgi:hypothetical protein